MKDHFLCVAAAWGGHASFPSDDDRLLCLSPLSFPSFSLYPHPDSPPSRPCPFRALWMVQLKQHALLWLVKRNQVRCFCEVWSPSTSYCVGTQRRGSKGTAVVWCVVLVCSTSLFYFHQCFAVPCSTMYSNKRLMTTCVPITVLFHLKVIFARRAKCDKAIYKKIHSHW